MTDFSLPTFLVSVETYPDHCCHLLYGPYVCAARNCQAASRVQRDPVHHVIQNILLFSSLALSSIHQLPNFRSNTEELLKHSLMAFSIRRTDQNKHFYSLASRNANEARPWHFHRDWSIMGLSCHSTILGGTDSRGSHANCTSHPPRPTQVSKTSLELTGNRKLVFSTLEKNTFMHQYLLACTTGRGYLWAHGSLWTECSAENCHSLICPLISTPVL